MNKIFEVITLICFLFFSANIAASAENFFNEAMAKYQNEKYEEARFLFERNIVYNPKDAKTYLYLAKIYNHKEDKQKEEKMSEKVIKVVSETLGVHIDRITAESHLVDDLGADDFDTVEVVIAIEKALGVKIADEDAEKIVTVQDIIKLVK